jgi:hypothetical protein
MTLISSGALGLKDAGANPSSNVLLDTGYNSLSFGADSSWAQYRRAFESEPGFSSYYGIQITDGTAYYYRRNTGSAARKTYIAFTNAGGYYSPIFTEAWDYMGTPPYGSWSGNDLALNSSTSSTVGSLGSSTYTDASSTVRTINDIGYLKNTSTFTSGGYSQNTGNQFWFSLAGNVPNSDNTFYQLTTYDNNGDGIIHTRSGASYDYDGIQSVWTWDNISDASIDFGNVKTASTRIYITRSGTTTFTNGISEEMSGNVATNNIEISDYYKGGIYHNTTGIPTSGQIEFSDFYGKTRVSPGVHSEALGYIFQSNQYYSSGAHAASSNFTFQGNTSKMTGLANVTTTSLSFIVAASGSTPIYTNSGWTQINVYQNQSNNSGSPDATLYRSNMTFSVSNNGTSSATASWTQSGSLGTFAFATYFGSTNGVTNFVEIV